MFYNFVLLAILNVTPFGETSAQTVVETPQPAVVLAMFLQEDGDKKTEPEKGAEVKKADDPKAPEAKANPGGEANLEEGDKAKEEKDKKEQPPAPWKNMLVMMLVAFAFFYFIILRPQQRERAKQKDKLESLKKNDRVVTIGGIIGTIAHFSEDGNEVTLKLDDNARVKMLRNSVRGLYSPEAENKDGGKS